MSVLNENTIIGASGASGGYRIDNSLRFNDDDSAYLSRTPSVAGNRKTWTWSDWVKRGNITTGTTNSLFGEFTDGSNHTVIRVDSSDFLDIRFTTSSNIYQLDSSNVFRDPSDWYHIVIAFDTTQALAADRVKAFVNNTSLTLTGTFPLLNADTSINDTKQHEIGGLVGVASSYLDGYLAEVNFIDGLALTPDSFGEFGDYGEWKPLKYAGAYGTNGFYLDFKDSGSLGNDAAGSNNWTPTNLAATDQMLDSPTNNFATLNPLHMSTSITLSEGNLKSATSTPWHKAVGTIPQSSGKWYFENVMTAEDWLIIGADQTSASINTHSGSDAGLKGFGWVFDTTNTRGSITYNAVANSYTYAGGLGCAVGDVLSIAMDLDTNNIKFFKNNVEYFNISSALESGAEYTFSISHYLGSSSVCNFGQDSSFAGNKTAQGNQDANGIGDFYYAPPAGFLALCTNNLDAITTPYQAYSSCGTEDEYLEVTYVGNGSTDGTFIYLGFLADTICIDGTSYTNASTTDFDFLANGIKCRSASTKNVNSTTYTLEAWVDRDFKYSNGELN